MASNLRSTLINGYRPNYIFWPVVELLRRFIFITAVVLTPGDLVYNTIYFVYTCVAAYTKNTTLPLKRAIHFNIQLASYSQLARF